MFSSLLSPYNHEVFWKNVLLLIDAVVPIGDSHMLGECPATELHHASHFTVGNILDFPGNYLVTQSCHHPLLFDTSTTSQILPCPESHLYSVIPGLPAAELFTADPLTAHSLSLTFLPML